MIVRQQRSWETRTHPFDFSDKEELIAGDTISIVNSVTVSPSVGAPTAGTPSISGSKVLVSFTGGTSINGYTVTCKITTSSGAILGVVGVLTIDDTQ